MSNGPPSMELITGYGVHSFKKVTAGIKEVIRKDREKNVVALLGWGFFGWQVRRSVEKALRNLNTDYLDVFKLGWLGRTSNL